VKLRILPRARFDIDRLHQFLAPKDPAAANRMVDAVLEAMLTLNLRQRRGGDYQQVSAS
jgi:hypothetical protein